jgi:hypothetical protein
LWAGLPRVRDHGSERRARVPFPYTGSLRTGTVDANGTYDFRFALFASEPVGADTDCLLNDPPNCTLWDEEITSVDVSAGRFSVNLGDTAAISDNVVAQDALWLAIAVKEEFDSGFSLLAGAQEILATPWAARAAAAKDYKVTGAMTVGGGLNVTAGGATVVGGLGVANGLTVSGGGANITGNMTASAVVSGSRLRLSSTQDVGLDEDGSLIIGPVDGANLGIDNNEIMARNASAGANLALNREGGNVTIGNGTSTVTANGNVDFAEGDLSGNRNSGGGQAPGGELMFRWGRGTSNVDGAQVFTFSSAFPTNCLYASINRERANAASVMSANSCNQSSVTVNRDDDINGDEAISYFAVGY